MKIGIVGARLAGSYAALILARMGHEVLLFDPRSSEKACGGGITGKALATMPWFNDYKLPYNEIRTVEMRAQSGCSVLIPLSRPIHIFSRATLDETLRARAINAGAQFHAERACRFESHGAAWEITTASGQTHEVEYVVGADGANSAVRTRVARKFKAADLCLALGHYVPGIYHPGKVIIVFQEAGFHGYLWSFPRLDHSSVGIICQLPDAFSSDLRHRVSDFISAAYPEASFGERTFYAARVPCLSRTTLIDQRVCGPGWALVGDAAGFVDAVTSEGIYYALRSAEILGEAFRAGRPGSYEQRWRSDFGAELERAAGWRDRFYGRKFLRRAFTERVVRMNHGSRTVRRITDAVISGYMSYRQIRSRLLTLSPRIVAEILRGKNGIRDSKFEIDN